LGSQNWIDDERNVPQPLGEFPPTRRPYFKGNLAVPAPPAVLIGTADCIANGDSLPLPAGLSRSLVSGIDSRCWSSQGLAVPASPVWAPLIWLTPASLPAFPDGTKVASWGDTSGNQLDATQPLSTAQPVLHLAGLGGLPELDVGNPQFLSWSGISLGNSHSLYVVGTTDSFSGSKLGGPGLMWTPSTGISPLLAAWNNTIGYGTPGHFVQQHYAGTVSRPTLWAIRRDTSSVELTVHALVVATFAIASSVVMTLTQLEATPAGLPASQRTRVSEVLVWPCRLDDAAHAGVIAYLSGKYGV